MVKKIALLGATGSIGGSCFKVVAEQRDHLSISLAAAHSNYSKLCPLALEFGIPTLVFTGIDDTSLQASIRREFPTLRIYFGKDSLLSLLLNEDYKIALNAIGGSNGIEATFAVLSRGKDLALANKESLVMGGHLVKKLQGNAKILPVDSEHSAIFQALGKHPLSEVEKLIITASGGAFRRTPLSDFPAITPQMALKHPNWDMGAKVTLDSATMFNKALEVMEAHWLFDLPYERIDAIIHPQSIIHSMVQYVDGSILAQMSVPDMSLPILYALSFPERWNSEIVQTELYRLPELSFEPIAKERYPLFHLGLEVARQGGILPTVMNAAVEAAMKLFLEQKIRFTDIPSLVYRTLSQTMQITDPDLKTILYTNETSYQLTLGYVSH